METRANYVMIGLFTILALFSAIFFTLWMSNSGIDKQESHFEVIFEGPVRGLEVGGEVRFNGIKVGEVTALNLSVKNPKDVVARIRVQSATPVKTDSIAQLEPSGLTGSAYIQILAGSDGAKRLYPRIGQNPPIIRSQRGQLDRVLQDGESILSSSLEAVTRLNKLLSAENMDNFTNILKEASLAAEAFRQTNQEAIVLARTARKFSDQSLKVAVTYDVLGKNLIVQSKTLSDESHGLIRASRLLVEGLNEDANSLSGGAELTLAKTMESLTQAQATMKEFNDTAIAMRIATNQFGAVAENTNRAVVSIDHFFKTGAEQTLPDLSRASQEIRNTAMTFDALGQQINRNPMELVNRPPPATVKWKQ
ncbi:MlaD family protein [Candidatus Phycosocius spiralis]|uniref:ABC transporter substrate-binding protein n=1 Tax=Candidatus Phycosocius spiralis TaxID=2815099 RepID=A0ABQ4PWQ9_9PROT|nr:MlaD family protein [Candidatus Phycosocius spiralis]GIU67370.1 ABC transporter substrate-binding protein [Candidatus Phycosocius spiralis]